MFCPSLVFFFHFFSFLPVIFHSSIICIMSSFSFLHSLHTFSSSLFQNLHPLVSLPILNLAIICIASFVVLTSFLSYNLHPFQLCPLILLHISIFLTPLSILWDVHLTLVLLPLFLLPLLLLFVLSILFPTTLTF